MIVWEWTIPSHYLHVQPVDDPTPVPAEYLNEEKYDKHPFVIRSTETDCELYCDKDFFVNFFTAVEDLPRIDEEWIKDFGVGKPTVMFVVYVDMPQRVIDEAKELADRYFPNKFLTSEEGFDYL